MSKNKVICMDFDGVFYDSTLSKGNAPSLEIEPITNTESFLSALNDQGYDLVILTCRAFTNEGKQGIRDWLIHYGLHGYITRITNIKEGAVAYIDNRSVPFDKEDPESYLDALDKVETLFKTRG